MKGLSCDLVRQSPDMRSHASTRTSQRQLEGNSFGAMHLPMPHLQFNEKRAGARDRITKATTQAWCDFLHLPYVWCRSIPR